uniref:Uncharacterized protein n=1 Tax=Rhizophora mucronata TaxID=61149 RepID=A0A2P2Q729_RHIMU
MLEDTMQALLKYIHIQPITLFSLGSDS